MGRRGHSSKTDISNARSVSMTVPRWVSWARYSYVFLAGLIAVCILIQVFFAGMAVFVDPANWRLHTNFVLIFDPLLFLLLVLAFIGKLPRILKIAPIGLFLLLVVQSTTANLFGSLVAAIHPVNAFVMFLIAISVIKQSWTWTSETIELTAD